MIKSNKLSESDETLSESDETLNESYEMFDHYDGVVYKSFRDKNGLLFNANPYNISLIMNFDFFSPYKHSKYSVGIIYFAVNNLPRNIRFKPENLIIAGIIPGPVEPQYTINTYLEPIVNDLLSLWFEGFEICINDQRTKLTAAVTCMSSDLPATRKLLGILGTNAINGCSKCWKKFPRNADNIPDYSGYTTYETKRTNQETRKTAKEWSKLTTAVAKETLEKEEGVRWSELHRLPYLDVIR